MTPPGNGAHALAQLAHPFAPISLEALDAKAALLERRDNKYVVRGSVLASALRAMACEFEALEIDGRRCFAYESCYFDDAGLRSYHDHRQGRRQRMKVRTRHYVDSALCFVEVKLKDKRGATVKRRMQYDPAFHGILDEAARAHVENCHHELYGRTHGHALEAMLRVRYLRTTLVARGGGERVTIDSCVHFDSAAGAWTTDDCFIVEAKSRSGNGLADRVLRRLHQHPTNGCSKYCVGMGVTGAVDRFNRFLPAMRKLGARPARRPAALKEVLWP